MPDIVNREMDSRSLMRTLRSGAHGCPQNVLPESLLWQTYLELRGRGEDRANTLFVGALWTLHGRRALAGSDLPRDDNHPQEHRLCTDDFLAELWKAYKRCIRENKTSPAGELLREIERVLA